MILTESFKLFDYKAALDALKEMCAWVAAQVGVPIRWVILAAFAAILIHWFGPWRKRA